MPDNTTDQYETGWNESNQDVAETVMWAADELKPLIVVCANGRTIRFTPTVV